MRRIVDENYEPIYCDALEDEYEYVGKKLDIVDVVRCKDCKHWAMRSWCSRLAPFDKVYMGEMDFCSRGERHDP